MANQVDPKVQAAYNREVEKGNVSLEARKALDQDIRDGKVKDVETLKTLLALADELTRSTSKRLGAEQKVSAEKQKQLELEAKVADEEYKLIDITSKLQGNIRGNRDDFVGIEKSATETVTALKQAYDAQFAAGDLTKAAYDERIKDLVAIKEIAKAQEALASIEGDRGDKLLMAYEEAKAYAESTANEIEGMFSKIPGGGLLFKYLGGEQLSDQLKGGVTKGFAAMGKAMGEKQSRLQVLRAGMQAFNATVMLNPMLLVVAAIVAAVAITAKLVGMAAEQTKLALEQAKAQGVSVNRAREQVVEANKAMASAKTQLADAKEILEVQNEINAALGASHMINAENAAVIADIGESMGYGAKVAGESAAALMHLGASAEEAATIQSEANLAAVQAGVDMGAVQKDIAKNAGTVSKYFAGNPKALAKAAIEAQKLGMSIDQMAKVSDGLLNIENSLQAQFEFQAFTGKQINMEKARQLALEGDIAGATKEVMKQVGDIHDFEKMNMKQREKLAAMAGMEVGELEKSLALQAKRGDMTDEELAAVSGLGLSMAEIKNMDADQLKQRAQQAQATEALSMQFQKMKQTIANALQPLLDIVGVLMTVLMPIFKVLGLTLKLAFLPLKIAFGIIKAMLDPVMELFNSFSGGGDIIGGISDGLDFVGDLIIQIGGFIAKFIQWPFTLAKFAVDLVRDNIDAIKDVLTKIGKFIFDYITAPFRLAIVVIKSVGQFLYDAITSPATAWGNFVENIKSGVNSVFEFIKAPFEWLMDKITAITEGAKKIANVLSFGLLGGDDEEEPEKMAAGGVAKGGMTLVGENGPELVNMPGGARVTQAGPTQGFLSNLGNMASSVMDASPFGAAANAVGNIFGGGSKDEQVELLKQILAAVQQPPPVVIGDGQVAQISTKISAQKSFKK